MSLLSTAFVSRRRAALACAVAAIAAACFFVPSAFADKDEPGPTSPSAVPQWDERVVELFDTLPVQADGRIKPFSVFAKFQLLKINHKSSMKTPSGAKRTAVEWALDTLFHPQLASSYRVLRVEDDAVLTDLGLRIEGRKKADRYSYDEIKPGLPRLRRQTARIREKMKERDLELDDLPRIEQALMRLGSKVGDLEGLLEFFDFGRSNLRVDVTPALKAHFGDRSEIPLSDFIPKAEDLGRAVGGSAQGPLAEDAAAIRELTGAVSMLLSGSSDPRIIPPAATKGIDWSSPWQVTRDAYAGQGVPPEHLAAVQQLERLAAATGKPVEFLNALRDFHKGSLELARARGEYEKIEMEVRFYRLDPFFKSMGIYLLAFLVVAFSWFRPSSRWLSWIAYVMIGGALLMHVYGIVLRCVLRDRPPVSTLYETVIFISGVAVLACLVIEWINRKRIAISVAPVLGALGLFMAQRYEVLNRQDTMPQLQAVLDTNFWLATHVVCITIGYSAGLLAGALGHLHVLGRAFGLKAGDRGFYTVLGRMIYGTLCFALLFSLVGTILGGIWANDSWGRFWGWDPKENGALMIVIWGLITLHARLGGFIKAHGIAMMSVFLTVVVAFSWWHVNLLGIGLHSYGFTKGILENLRIFYAVEASVLLTGLVWWLQSRKATPPASN